MQRVPPTLSVGIAKLERSLGSALFFRSSQRVQLTGAGTRFLTHARRIETEFNLAQQAMTTVSMAPVLRIGILHSVPGSIIAAAVASTLADQPATPIEILYGTERELVAHLAPDRLQRNLRLEVRTIPLPYVAGSLTRLIHGEHGNGLAIVA